MANNVEDICVGFVGLGIIIFGISCLAGVVGLVVALWKYILF